MEKVISAYDKECMRMAMLKHEEMFKQQVYELHRLYQVQTILMKKMEISKRARGPNRELWNSKNHVGNRFIRNIDHHRLDVEQNSRMKMDLDRPAPGDYKSAESNVEIIDESEIELTLGPSSYSSRRKKKSDTPMNSDSGPSFSSSSTGSSNNNSSKKGNAGDDIQEQKLRQERLNQQPWLYQVLSLNVT